MRGDKLKEEVIDVDKICKHGKENGVSYAEMAECLGVSRQRLHQFRMYNDRIYALDFIKLCELCAVDLSDWKNYIKEVDLEKESRTKRERNRLKIKKGEEIHKEE